MRAAVILAGGYSKRFGPQDKALAEIDGDPLVRRVTERVAPTVEEVIVNCRPEQRADVASALSGLDYRLALDPAPDKGPVAGIQTGCRATRADWTFVVACDLPLVTSTLASRLFEAAEADGAVPRIDGRFRPLAAVYRTSVAIEAAKATLEDDSGAVMALFDRLSTATVLDPAPGWVVADVDTRAELRALRAKVDAQAGRSPVEPSAVAPQGYVAPDSR
jgi:molybdopterin-guanine dinucleotide biosynthesis protein A